VGAIVAVLALLLVGGLSTLAALHSAGRLPWSDSGPGATAEIGTEPDELPSGADDDINVIELR
jgi:hypothetical protein